MWIANAERPIAPNSGVKAPVGGISGGFADSVERAKGSGDQATPGVSAGTSLFQLSPFLDSKAAANAALGICQNHTSDSSDPPDRSEFGYTLGVVGDMSIWLLRTESMPLALITGLIGFGLFGALVSTFVRLPAGQVVQSDILAIVWRGVSAAIVVFLAAYGGIAVVSQNSGDPNPYIVFVTCLVGAVFGDDVWLWAKDKFVPKSGDAAEPTKPAAKG
jgi:hypothetical protein